MKTKNILVLSLIAVMATLSVGCAPKKDQKTRISARGVRGGEAAGNVTAPPGSGAPSAAGKQWGEVTKGSYTQENFQYHVQNFLSNMKDESGAQLAIGDVSGLSGQNTGIRFWGSAQLQQGKLNPNGSGSGTIVSTGSALRISIIDNYVGQTNSDGETITEVPVYIAPEVSGFKQVAGTVNGNKVIIVYQDGFGKVELNGSFTAQWFTGYIKYDNDFYYNGVKPGAAGYLGTFAVPTCGFFSCQ